jgi:hypothetical protein
MYQFNLNEIDEAALFAKENNIGMSPSLAYINDHDRFKKYLKDEWTASGLKVAGEDLILYGISKRLAEFRSKFGGSGGMYKCPIINDLAIDHRCNVLTCCSESSVYKKIYDVSEVDEIDNWKNSGQICRECIDIGLSYIGTNAVPYHEFFGKTLSV